MVISIDVGRFFRWVGEAQIWAVKKKSKLTQKVGGSGSMPPRKMFQNEIEIISEAVFQSKMPPVLPVSFGKQNS